MFNAKNVVCSFSMSISIAFGAIRSWNVSRRSKLPKIHIEFSGNRQPAVYDFLLVINNNLCPISHCYWDTAIYWLKIANFSHPLSFSALVRDDPLRVYGKAFTVPETRLFPCSDGKNLVILTCTIYGWFTRETDERTGRISGVFRIWQRGGMTSARSASL